MKRPVNEQDFASDHMEDDQRQPKIAIGHKRLKAVPSSLLFRLCRILRYNLGSMRRAFPKFRSVFSNLLRVVKILVDRLLHRSDYHRWANPENLEAWWEPRTQKIARLVPKNSRVIEFGAGRRPLERYLDSSCTYFPSDLVDRGPGTIICDLNARPLPDLKPALNPDVAVLAGVLEYIRDLPSLIEWLSHQVSYCVASYTYAESEPGTIRRIEEVFRRSYYGYLNEYREEEIVALFKTYGFICVEKDRWDSQIIFFFALAAQTLISTI